MIDFSNHISDLLESARFELSTINPSDWCEANRSMDSSVSRFKGRFSYDITPYTREIVDCLSPEHPARIVSVMKAAQIGYSTGVIEAGIGWIISQQPGNILFLTGHSDLSTEAVAKIDNMIDSCGIRNLIRANVKRTNNRKTGDTNTKKEFPGGSLISGSAGNHKLLRQRSVMYGFIDDFDAAKKESKDSGNTRKMIEARFAAYSDKMKLMYISTPELKQTSNIEPVYLMGDRRKYFIPCPCCGEMITYEWSIDIEGTDGKEKGGITYKLDNNGKLIADSVGYICQKCSGFFDDSKKYELNLAGIWQPTADPVNPSYYSYHINSLYAPPGMKSWTGYVNDYLEACPPAEDIKDHLYKTFVNLCLGLPYEQKGKAIKANTLQKNIRDYDISTIPEKLSIKDGNGRIILLTCACDLNGIVDDARLDYEIVGWSEAGSSYSILHGSIGTFVPRENSKRFKEDRERWTYEFNGQRSVWNEFSNILETKFKTDTGRAMSVFITAVDTGYYTTYAHTFIDKTNHNVFGVKGKDTGYVKFGIDLPSFRPSKEKQKVYILEANQLKDQLSDLISLKYDSGNDEKQPPGFMNFPTPSEGKYLYGNYFSHYEAEHRVTETKDGEGIAARWVKKSSIAQNHFFDVRIYNLAIRDIFVDLVGQEAKIKKATWSDYVAMIPK